MRRQLRVLATVAALTLGVAGAGSAQASPAAQGCPTAELFATDNTAIITDPADSRLDTRLTRFDHEVREIIHVGGAEPGSSTLLDGVSWSADLEKAIYERSREFDVDQVGRDGLHHIADVLAKQYHQESVTLDGRLILVAPLADLPVAQRFTAELGVDWNRAEVRYGDEEFVS